MYYWFIYNTTTGAVGVNQSTHPPLTASGEFDPNLISAGCLILGPYESLDSTQQAAFNTPQAYLYQNGVFVSNPNYPAIQLRSAKTAKIEEIQQTYQAEVNSTFTSSATGTALVYNYSNQGSPSAQDTWNDLFKAIDKNLLPSTVFPMPVTLANGTVVDHTQTQLEQIETDIAAWKFPLYQKYQKLVTSTIPACTTVDDVNAISW